MELAGIGREKIMRSLQVAEFGEPLVWNERPAPEPEGAEVLLKTLSCGICHSDLHIWDGFYEMGSGKRLYAKDRGLTLPLTMGHEVVGQVVAKGPLAKSVNVGDVRLVYPWIGCGACRACRAGLHHVCTKPGSVGVFRHGGYSDHILVPEDQFLVDIDGLAPEFACSYACAGLTAYSALLKTLPLSREDDLVVIGAGGLGLMALHVVRELTQARLIVVDINERNLEAARMLVDCVTINSRSGAAADQVREVAGAAGVRAVVDFVGSGDTAALGYSLLAKSGTLVLVGLFGGELSVSIPPIPLRNLTICGSYTGSLVELRELIGLAKTGRLPPLPVTCYPIDQAQTALEQLRAGQITGRAVLRPEND
jgi:alcohol dehydrogenase, propanol-preferring